MELGWGGPVGPGCSSSPCPSTLPPPPAHPAPHSALTSRKPESSVCSSSFSSFLLSLYLSPSLPECAWNTLMSVSIAVSSSEPISHLPRPQQGSKLGTQLRASGVGVSGALRAGPGPSPEIALGSEPHCSSRSLGPCDVGTQGGLNLSLFSVCLIPHPSRGSQGLGPWR